MTSGPSSILAQLLCLLNVKNSNNCERESDMLCAILYILLFLFIFLLCVLRDWSGRSKFSSFGLIFQIL